MAGIYVSVLIHDHRIRDLSGPAYAAMHQMRDKTFRVVMPIIGMTMLASLIMNAILNRSGLPGALFAAAFLVALTDAGLTIRHQLPLNKLIQSWNADHPPAGWESARDGWARGHNLRIVLGVAVYVASLSATILLAQNGR